MIEIKLTNWVNWNARVKDEAISWSENKRLKQAQVLCRCGTELISASKISANGHRRGFYRPLGDLSSYHNSLLVLEDDPARRHRQSAGFLISSLVTRNDDLPHAERNFNSFLTCLRIFWAWTARHYVCNLLSEFLCSSQTRATPNNSDHWALFLDNQHNEAVHFCAEHYLLMIIESWLKANKAKLLFHPRPSLHTLLSLIAVSLLEQKTVGGEKT